MGVACRSAKALSNWALSLVPSNVAEIDGPSKLQTLLQTCGGGSGAGGGGASRSGKGKAKWDACVVMVTNKTETPVLYKALSR